MKVYIVVDGSGQIITVCFSEIQAKKMRINNE